jgi:hypothetical protein
MNTTKSVKISLAAAALALPLIASAASTVTTGTGTLTATATVNFTVVIPQYLYLRVGAGSTYATGALTTVATQDLITFSPAAGAVGNGVAVAGTGGDLTGGVETAAVIGNGGNVTLTAAATGPLTSAGGDTIPFTQITTAAVANTATYTTLAAPALSNTSTSETINATNKVVMADAKWTFSYANSAAEPAGTYGGTTALNGVVTYTASMP